MTSSYSLICFQCHIVLSNLLDLQSITLCIVLFVLFSLFHFYLCSRTHKLPNTQVLDSEGLSSRLEEKAISALNAASTQIPKRKPGGPSFRRKSKSCQSESASSSEVKPNNDITSSVKSTSAGKSSNDKRSSKRIAENVLVAKKKKQKKMVTSDSDRRESEDNSIPTKVKPTSSRKSRRKESPVLDFDKSLQEEATSGASNESDGNLPMTSSGDTLKKEEFVDENMYKQELVDNKCWKPFEKALYEKGIQIFGCNR